jgi:hypothetical protein
MRKTAWLPPGQKPVQPAPEAPSEEVLQHATELSLTRDDGLSHRATSLNLDLSLLLLMGVHALVEFLEPCQWLLLAKKCDLIRDGDVHGVFVDAVVFQVLEQAVARDVLLCPIEVVCDLTPAQIAPP